MEAKLKEYRALRQRKELIENTKAKLHQSKETLLNFLTPKFVSDMAVTEEEEHILMGHEETEYVTDGSEFMPEPQIETLEVDELEDFVEDDNAWRKFLIRWSMYLSVWLIFYGLFLYIQFGAVYFVITGLFGIYFNTRTRPKRKGEISAYSVFNRNCSSIDGTLKAEELQRQMMLGAGGIF